MNTFVDTNATIREAYEREGEMVLLDVSLNVLCIRKENDHSCAYQ